MKLSLNTVMQVKQNALLGLENFLLKRLESQDEKQIKIVQTMSFWILDYIRLQTYETHYIRYKKYKRGDVIKVNFGHRIGREHGGLHYAIVIDNDNALASNTITVIPLSSFKSHLDKNHLGKDRLYLGIEIYKLLIDKLNSLNSHSQEATVVKKELSRMKTGTIALIGQITTISKYRIYDPLSTKNALHKIRLSDNTLDDIDCKIRELFTHNN